MAGQQKIREDIAFRCDGYFWRFSVISYPIRKLNFLVTAWFSGLSPQFNKLRGHDGLFGVFPKRLIANNLSSILERQRNEKIAKFTFSHNVFEFSTEQQWPWHCQICSSFHAAPDVYTVTGMDVCC